MPEGTLADGLKGSETCPETLLAELSSDDWQGRRHATAIIASLGDTEIDTRLLALVAHDDPGTRNAALKALIKRADTSLPLLVDGLVSGDERVRILCAVAIGQTGSDAAVPLLRDLFDRDEDLNVRYMIVEALGRIGGPAVTPLLLRALEEDRWLAAPAAEALGRFGTRDAVEPLLAMVDDDLLGGVAINALGLIGDLRALPSLCAALADCGPAAAGALVISVGRLLASAPMSLESAVRSLMAPMPPVGDHAFTALHHMLRCGGESSRTALTVISHLHDARFAEILFDVADEPGLYDLAAEVLACTPPAEESVILHAAHSPVVTRRLLAAHEACRRPLQGSLLLGLIDDTDAGVRGLALAGVLSADTAVTGVIGCLTDPDAGVRATALDWLLDHGIEDCGWLETLIRTGDRATRVSAARALAACSPSPCAMRLAEACARDESAQVRAAVARALRATPALATHTVTESLLCDPDAAVRAAAVDLALTTQQPELDVVATWAEDESALVRSAVARHAYDHSHSGDFLVAYLLGDEDPRVVVAALRVLDGPVHDRLNRQLARLAASEFSEVREAVVRACARTAMSREACTYLLPALGDSAWNVRAAAVELVASVSPSDMHVVVAEALCDVDPTVRRAATRGVEPGCSSETLAGLEQLLTDPEVGGDARAALATLGPAGYSILECDIRAGRAHNALLSALALCACHTPEAAEIITAITLDADPGIRFPMEFALGTNGAHA